MYTAVSSENSWVGDIRFSGKSLMYTKNKLGPRKEPWGTPEQTPMKLDLVPSTTTAHLWLLRKLVVCSMVVSWMP